MRLGLVELQERDSQDNVLAENVWRLDMPGGVGDLIARVEGNQHYSYLTNHLGHVYGVLDNEGNRITTHAYTPYGEASGDSFSTQPFGFSTKRADFHSGLVYFGYRFYMPHTGRWLNRDPLQEAGGINLYAYVMGDPLGYVDPDGRWSISIKKYSGRGGNLTIGHDPNSGYTWIKVGGGLGLGHGISSNRYDTGDGCTGVRYGAEAGWGVDYKGMGFEGRTVSDGLTVNEDKGNSLFNPQINYEPSEEHSGWNLGGDIGVYLKYGWYF
ncbi:RHS repeat-associated core domain-containing protein [Vibrio sp. NTOU-M3]|uniref:RHS repeat-associated core domain-containing protein n=1 Tax=Vibrio sp. NTOU-M3 TaxID=3234954 RepID=UPI00349F1D22